MAGPNYEYLGKQVSPKPRRYYGLSQLEFTEDGLRRATGPVSSWFAAMLPVVHKNTGIRGNGVSEQDLNHWIVGCTWACFTEGGFMNVVESLKENYEEADKLWSGYKDRLNEFRSVVKNDVVSLEASARKTAEAVHKMNKAYGDVILQLNSVEMQQAVANAERLAAALSSLAQLQSQKLVFAVTDQSAISPADLPTPQP